MSEYAKKWREQRRIDGLCVNCDNQSQIEKIRCLQCSQVQNEKTKERRDAKKKQGRCKCCEEKSLLGKVVCQKHLDEHKKWRDDEIIRRRKLGLCNYFGCKTSAIVDENRKFGLCEQHYLQTLSRSHFNNCKRWQELKEIFYNNPVCPYTGIKLKLGVNASLDHIIPKAKKGTNDKHNLQFVYCFDDFDVNRMKGEMTSDEFKKAIDVLSTHMRGEQ